MTRVSIDDNGCWNSGWSVKQGWTKIWHRGAMQYVHRVMYEEDVGPIPDGLEIDHLCRNRACCNPAHLEPVTHSENVARSVARRIAKGERTKHYRKRP